LFALNHFFVKVITEDAMRIDWFISVVLRGALSVIMLVILARAPVANAAEIKVLGARAAWTVWNEIGPEFERTTGHKVKIIVGLAPAFKRQIDAGETVDVVISSDSLIDELIKEGKIITGTRTIFARLRLRWTHLSRQ
jgi:molybdate transport system substrate-binding protein